MKFITNCASVLILAGVTVAFSHPLLAQANPAHAHIGHVADGWSDTPGGMGFLPTAKAEAEIAVRHAGLAVNAGDIAGIKTHITHVMHAIDPETMESGPGKGYGVIKATRGVATHINLAAESEGASDNVKLHANHMSASANNVVEWGLAVLDQARTIQETEDQARAAELATEVQTLCNKILNGYDQNEDGRIGWGPNEGGLEQVEFHLGLMKRGEGIEGDR